MRTYQICKKCIMDTTDPEISFDERGICSHCGNYETNIRADISEKHKAGALEHIVRQIKHKGDGKAYDCVIGVSGGVDSTYVAYLAKKLGLRPLAVHLDNGWNSELAVNNIERTLKKLDIELYTHVLSWDDFKRLQRAFLKASTPDAEIPTDHAIVALLYRIAAKKNIKYVLIGRNSSTESGGVAAWSQGHGDWRYIKKVYDSFSKVPLKKYPHYGPLRLIFYSVIKGIRMIPILDYVDYVKAEAINTLREELAWQYYGGKHYESVYTRFFQGYILPNKFGFNKRREHLSSLIWSGQISRENALAEIQQSDYPDELQKQDREFVLKKFGFSDDEFNEIMKASPKTFWDYPSYKKLVHDRKWIIALYHAIKQ